MLTVLKPRHTAAVVAAMLGLSACSRPNNTWDNALNSAQAEAKAEQRAMKSPQAQAGANMALAPLSNSAAPSTNGAP